MPGSIAMNLHEGFRSEYLAQYVFASVGTAVSIPSQEDHGLDLYCTLVDKLGTRAWLKAYFSVQVKSKSDTVSWDFKGKEEVRWLIEYPLPLFLCVVDKKKARLEIYQTLPRFEVWTLPPFPENLRLVPGVGPEGGFTKWEEGGERSLSAPILDFSIAEMLEDGFPERVQQILFEWIKFDEANIHRVKSGIYSMSRPAKYQTNSSNITDSSIIWFSLGQASQQYMELSLQRLREQLSWVIQQLQIADFSAAVRAALLHRYLSKSSPDRLVDIDPFFMRNINVRFNSDKYFYDGLDRLDKRLDEIIGELSHKSKYLNLNSRTR